MIRFSFCQKFHVPFSYKKSCLFLLGFTFFIITILGVPLLCIFIVLKPQMPDFSVHTVNVKSYKLNITTSKNLLVSSVSSLNLTAENPNKVGLSFGPCKLHVLSQGLVVGLIRIPQFHQPPLSKNVTVQTQVLFDSLNVSEIMSRKNPVSKSINGIRILGDIKAQVRVFQITLPTIKIAMDCEITVNQSPLSVISNEIYNMKKSQNHKISLSLDSKTLSRKCSVAILM